MTYKDILQSDYFFETYSKVEVLKRDFPVNHGFLHVWHVIKNAKELARTFNLTENETELLLIAATLHDIGYIEGRKDHDINGARLANEFLKDLMPLNDVENVCSAISRHGGENVEDYTDIISLCLILADKFDFDNTRYRPDPTWPSVNMYLSIEKVEFKKKDNDFEFVIFTNDITLFENYQEQHFFKKLARVFANFEKATKRKIALIFKEV